MIKAKMLNEMNPKLRALLAAGLIGTAGLGAASCSVDGSYDEPPVEQPAPENPETPETPESTVTFETLGVQPKYFASLARADKYEDNIIQITVTDGYKSFIYKDNENGLVPIEFKNNQYEDGHSYISYIDDIDDTDWYLYYVPEDMEDSFDKAIKAYK